MLSSHFLTSQQKTDLQRAAASLRAAHISSLLSCDSVSHELRQLETSLNNVSLPKKNSMIFEKIQFLHVILEKAPLFSKDNSLTENFVGVCFLSKVSCYTRIAINSACYI